jgi:hypothetical protein
MWVKTGVQFGQDCNVLWSSGGVHPFSEGLSGLKIQVQRVIKNSFFVDVIQLLVTRSHKFYCQYLNILYNESGHTWLSDMSAQDFYIFLPVLMESRHGLRDVLKDCWFSLEQFYTPYYIDTMKYIWFLHILKFLHFYSSMNQPDKKCRELW